MSEPRVIRADYSNWRPVAGRKVLQLILEVPIEQTADVMKKLGFPLPGESKWVAVALLNEKPSSPHSLPINGNNGEAKLATAPANDGIAGSATKERKPFASLPLSQQAAIRCGDVDFQKFMVERYAGPNPYRASADNAAIMVREACGIASRSEILRGTASELLWESIEEKYQAWLTTQRYASVAR